LATVIRKPGTIRPAPGSYEDILSKLTGSKRDAAAALLSVFEEYGLGTLGPKIVDYIQQGYSGDTITVLLRETPEYKQRFIGNEARRKKGLPLLSPAEYISTERSYRQLMAAAGLPIGFYDSTEDFRKFIENDTSPTEVKQRIDTVSEALNRAPASTVDYFKQWYTTGDMIAYALDPKRAAPLIDQRVRAAEAAALAQQQNVQLGQNAAEMIGRSGASYDQTQQGIGFIGTELPNATKLGDIYGTQIGAEDLVQEVFTEDSTAARKRRGLASQERASFGGATGQGKGSLSKGESGSY
jgi:hypothetical protein